MINPRSMSASDLEQRRAAYASARSGGTASRLQATGCDAVAWTWINAKGQPCAVAYAGRSLKPIGGNSYFFKSEILRDAWLKQCFDRELLSEQAKQERIDTRRQQMAQPHLLEVGDVLVSSWGYDQTNIDYYQVTALAGKRTVEIREIESQSEATGQMMGQCVPALGKFAGPPMRRRVGFDQHSVRVDSVRHARKLEPKIVGGIKIFPGHTWTAYA